MNTRIKEALLRCNALAYGDFTLASGKKSPYYIDIKKASTDPSVLEELADEMARQLERGDIVFDKIAGVVLGSIPIAVALSLRTKVPYIMVRKEKKDHGTQKMIEGTLDPGDLVLMVEDVITSAGSVCEAIEIVRGAGGFVCDVFCVVDRQEGRGRSIEGDERTSYIARDRRTVAEKMTQIKDCKACGLCDGRTNVVCPEGDPSSPIAFVGEAPGEREDKEGRPFVGRSGKLLTRLLDEGGLPRSKIFITNTVKCRPPENRAPRKKGDGSLSSLFRERT